MHLLKGRLRKINGDIEKEHTILERDQNVVVNPNPLSSTPIQVDTATRDPASSNTRSHIIPPTEVSDQAMLEGDELVIYPTHSYQPPFKTQPLLI